MQGLRVRSPPGEILINDASRVGKYVHHLIWAASSEPFPNTVVVNPLPIFSKLTSVKTFTFMILDDMEEEQWHEILCTARLWPTERLQMVLSTMSRAFGFYDLLFNGQQVDIPRSPPVSQWNLTHISFGSDYSIATNSPFLWLLGCTPAVLGRLTHVRVMFGVLTRCEPFDVDWDVLFFKLPLVKLVVLQYAYPPKKARRRQIETLPEKKKEKRLLCCSYPSQVAMGSLVWDGRGARGRVGRCADVWEAAELVSAIGLTHVDQYFTGHAKEWEGNNLKFSVE